jgi:hypothetical protein
MEQSLCRGFDSSRRRFPVLVREASYPTHILRPLMLNRPISGFVLTITVTAASDDSGVIYFADDCDSILCAEVVLRNEVINLSRM